MPSINQVFCETCAAWLLDSAVEAHLNANTTHVVVTKTRWVPVSEEKDDIEDVAQAPPAVSNAAQAGGGGAKAVVGARRTTAFTATTTITDVTFDTTDEENDAATVQHNDTNTDDIDIKVTGMYRISYKANFLGQNNTDLLGRVRINDTAVIGPSQDETNTGTHNQAHAMELDRTFLVSLTAGDKITLQIWRIGGSDSTTQPDSDCLLLVEKV